MRAHTRLRLLTRQRRRALQFGYTIYRQVLNYYSGEEDAYGAWAARQVHAQLPVLCADAPSRAPSRADMRKAMPRDVHKRSIVPLKRPIQPWELEHD